MHQSASEFQYPQHLQSAASQQQMDLQHSEQIRNNRWRRCAQTVYH